jgi:hypothetical protein
VLSFAKDEDAVIVKLSLFGDDSSVKDIVVTLNYFVYLPAAIFVGYFPDRLISLLFVPLWGFEVGYFFLGVVVELLLEERLVLHIFFVKILRAFSGGGSREYITIARIFILSVDEVR